MAQTTTSGKTPGGLAGVLTDPRQANGMQSADSPDEPEDEETSEQEEKQVAKFFKEYDRDRKFDENFRKQVAIDRRYAAGTSDLSWAVTTNLIGAFIDILVALLYARDPDVSVTKAAQVNNANTAPMDAFARTLQIVISQLWVRGKLKKAARKGVRSVLSNSEGWFKCIQISEKVPNAEVETALNDARELHQRLVAQQKMLEDPDETDIETRQSIIDEKEAIIEALEEKMELSINKIFVIDFIKTENMQVSTDVECIADYLDADWLGNEMYVTEEAALEMFEALKPEDVKKAKKYFQSQPRELSTREVDNAMPQGTLTAESASAYVTQGSDADGQPFVRVVERWYRTDKHIRTAIEGVKKWAKKPFEPPYPTSRFYPYFYFAFYEVDGQRHAQSLSWRLYKLQDEYSSTRSNFRIARERSLPGTFVNASQLDDTEMDKIKNSKINEFTVLKPADPDTPIGNLFAAKPVPAMDMRVFDVTMILNDMERISGVQEALSAAISGPGNPKTATEANIQQSGTNARTTSDRDCLEWMLTDLALYTAELALQCYTVKEVQRMAGPQANWPGPDPDADPPVKGMSIEDLFTMVEISIAAGTTGKPKMQADQQAWATILPLIRQLIGEIEQALGAGNLALVSALTELISETMLRFGDESDVDRFIPRQPPPNSPGAGTPPMPPKPPVSVSLKGEISPAAAMELIQPDLPQPPPPPAAPAGSPPGPSGPGAAPTPQAGPQVPPQLGK